MVEIVLHERDISAPGGEEKGDIFTLWTLGGVRGFYI